MKNELVNNKFYIYGYGEYAKQLLKVLYRIGLKPKAIFDKYKYGEKDIYFGEISKLSASDLSLDFPILITILGYPEIEKELFSLGFMKLIGATEIFNIFPEALKKLVNDKFMWRKQPESFLITKQDSEKINDLLTDKKSKETFKNLILFRKTGSARYYLNPEDYRMYFPFDICELYKYKEKRILDIGAYDGDTLTDFFTRYKDEIKKYICIEANKKNISKLLERINKERKLKYGKIEVIFGAVGIDLNKKNILMDDNGSASSIKNNNPVKIKKEKVPVLDLLKIAKKFKPNIIKMDIEGCDMSALSQLKDFISRDLPTLALSAYHNPKDLWEMPLYLDLITNGKYYFYYRQEGHWGLETQLYAIPKNNE